MQMNGYGQILPTPHLLGALCHSRSPMVFKRAGSGLEIFQLLSLIGNVTDQPVLPQPYRGGMYRGVGTQVRSGVGVQKVPGCP